MWASCKDFTFRNSSSLSAKRLRTSPMLTSLQTSTPYRHVFAPDPGDLPTRRLQGLQGLILRASAPKSFKRSMSDLPRLVGSW